ncbi:MAG: hypothetical protein Q7S25_02510, partial [Candidatus Limnocylindria bacterium]|nr:hypothetical protein [Candidatus Limnocylindria bacterium]
MTTTRTTKPKSDARRGLARAVAALLALSLAACTAPEPPPPAGDVPDGQRFARDAAASLLTLSAYDYALAGALGGERTRIVVPDRYAAVARATARALGTLNAAVVAASASASGPVRDRLVPLADALTDLAGSANAYADGREPAAFARVIALVALSWDRLRELVGVLPPDDALVRTLARGTALGAGARDET